MDCLAELAWEKRREAAGKPGKKKNYFCKYDIAEIIAAKEGRPATAASSHQRRQGAGAGAAIPLLPEGEPNLSFTSKVSMLARAA